MKPLSLFLGLLLITGSAFAQTTTTKTTKHKTHKTTAQQKKSRVYYPDYRAFYDPNKEEYTFWGENQWTTAPQRPSFMKDADMGKVRVQVLHDESLNDNPQDHYEQYLRQYPPQQTTPTTPVPILTIGGK